MNPLIEEHQLSKTDARRNSYVKKEKDNGNPAYGMWNGDCWKSWVKLRSTRKDLEMFVVDTDYGCGIIKKGIQQTLSVSENDITFSNLEKNRKEWLNLIDVEEFFKKIL
jgi:hypothetical protein